MHNVPRRTFIKQAGQAAAVGYLGSGLAAVRGRIIIIAPKEMRLAAAAPVRFAVDELRRAVEEKGDSCGVVGSASDAGAFDFAVVLAAGAPSELPTEAFRLAPAKVASKPAVHVFGPDARGLVYALLELADRVRYGSNPVAALAIARSIQEQPANRVRSIARTFVSDVEDKPWYHDKPFWRDYLTTLVAHRFNRFSLSFGFGYDFPFGVTGDYLHFPYPYLFDVPGYHVRADPLDDTERDRNLEMLRFISEEAERRGLHFQLGMWTHAYEWTNSPNSHHHIRGLTPETHGPYCRDAMALLLTECPAIRGLTLRVHGESGVPEGSYDFWRTVFQGIVRAGRPIEIDMHAKGMDAKMMDVALETGMPVKISPKYWAEHMGLGYHQAAIRDLEMPRPGEKVEGTFSLSNGTRRFLRYGYGDLYQAGRRYDIIYRVWPGTQRLLLWGDPAMAAAYGRTAHFCDASGVEICEPLFFKGRQGTGLAGGRCAYADESLNPKGGDFQKYAYTYRLLGRLLYNPDADPNTWRRYLNAEFGAAAAPVETALSQASRVLPLITTAHIPSASNLGCWMEVYTNMPIVEGGAPVPYGDTVQPKRLGTVSPLDPQLFSSVEEYVGGVLDHRESGKYSPIEVAQWLENAAQTADREIGTAVSRAPSPKAPEFRRVEEDVRIQVGLGRFFAAQLRSCALFEIYRQTGDVTAREQAIATYRRARDAWSAMAERARGVYRADITFGDARVRRGHWIDRLPAIDRDLAAMEAAHLSAVRSTPVNAEAIQSAISAATGQPRRVVLNCEHRSPSAFRPGSPVALAVKPGSPVAGARLFYRRVDQSERWESIEMTGGRQEFTAVIPAGYTQSPYPLEYYFEFRRDGSGPWLYPGFTPDLASQPYYVVMSGAAVS